MLMRRKEGQGLIMEKGKFMGMLISLLIVSLFSGCGAERPAGLGVKDGRFSPCPASPNCVSSQSEDEKHRIDPLRFTSTPEEAMNRLKEIVRSMKRTTVIRETPDYLYVEFRTFLGFVDDVEFYVDESRRVIQMRSASRRGYSDLGVNRRRMETIREEFGKR